MATVRSFTRELRGAKQSLPLQEPRAVAPPGQRRSSGTVPCRHSHGPLLARRVQLPVMSWQRLETAWGPKGPHNTKAEPAGAWQGSTVGSVSRDWLHSKPFGFFVFFFFFEDSDFREK